MYIRYNEKQQDQHNENEIELLGRDRNSQLMTMTDSNDIFTSHMSVVLTDTACDFKGIPKNRTSQYIMVRAPNNMPS